MSERKSVRWDPRNLNNAGRPLQAFKVKFGIYNQAIFLLNLSKRKDHKPEVLAQICEKYLCRVGIILVLVRFEIFDHCIHSSTGQQSIQGKISKSTPVKKQRNICWKFQIRKSLEGVMLSPVTKPSNRKSWNLGRRGFKYPQYLNKENSNIDQYLDTKANMCKKTGRSSP